MAVLKNKTGMYKEITILRCVMLLTLTCSLQVSTDMAVTPFKLPPLFRTPKNVEIPKRLGVRAMVVDSKTIFF